MAGLDSGRRESYFTNCDGKRIYCYYWCEDLKPPRALVLISHGVAEHCLWYTPMAMLLKEAGCYVFAHDHVGHGRSEGDRVHVNDFQDYVQDTFQHFDTVAEQFPGVPKYIIGHSMGGTISILAAIEKPDYFDGVILIAPAVKADPSIATPVRVFAGKIASVLCPQFPIANFDVSNISRDPAVVSRYINDPLVYHGSLKARWGVSFLKWMEFIIGNMNKLKSPLLVLHGTEDKVTLCEGSRILVDGVFSQDKTLKVYEGYYHQLHTEPAEDGAGVRRDIADWIISRLKK